MTDLSRVPGRRVRALWRRVAAQLAIASIGGAIAALGLVFLAAALAGRLSLWQRPSGLPFALWLFFGAAAALWFVYTGRRLHRWRRQDAAAEIEATRRWPRGTLRGAVEDGLERQPGVSHALIDRQRRWLGQALQDRPSELGNGIARSTRRLFAGAGVLALAVWTAAGAASLWLPGVKASWSELGHPVRHMSRPPLPPLRLQADANEVRRGRDLSVAVRAPERDSVRLVWLPEGELSSDAWLAVGSGMARGRIPRVEATTRFWATAPDGATSDTLRVVPRDPLLIIDLDVALRFPVHTERPSERASPPLPLFEVPEGTWATVSGKTTRTLARADLRSGSGGTVGFGVDDRRFRRSFRVRDGDWGWEMVSADGSTLEGRPDSLRFRTLPDSAPVVTIVYPGVDTVMSVQMTQPLVVDARDDYGLSHVELVSWRVSSSGEEWPPVTEPILTDGDAARAHLNPVLDIRGRGFFPGDAVHYFVRARDNAPDPQEGRSREYVLRLPTLDEVRERTVTDAWDLVDEAERLADEARTHEQEAASLERSGAVTPPPGARSGAAAGQESAVEYRETESARRTLEEAEGLIEHAREIQEAMRELDAAIERAGLNDTSVLNKLREIQSLYERILTPELRDRLEQLQEALRDLDSERIREAVRRLAEGSSDFRQRVEQSVELLRRAALEHEFGVLETQAEEMVRRHEQLAEAAEEDTEAAELSSRAGELAERADSLRARISQLAEQLQQAGESEPGAHARDAASRTERARAADDELARELSGDRQGARQAARRALSQMEAALQSLRQGRSRMQASWRGEVVAALERARAEAQELARRQQKLNERLSRGEAPGESALRSDEVALRRGLDQIEHQLTEAGQSSLLVDPSLSGLTEQIGRQFEQLLEQMSQARSGRQVDPRLGSQVAEGLNELAYRLMQAGDAASQGGSGTGLQEALQQLSQLAEQQGRLNSQTGGLTPGSLGDLLAARLEQLARQQAEIARDIQEIDRSMGGRGQVLGRLDEMSREAREIAESMERGGVDRELVERQERLFRRLLDAGRTLERDEFEKRRQAESPSVAESRDGGPLPSDIFSAPRFPHPSADALQGFGPELRRMILEYFDRLNGLEAADGP